MLQVVGDEGGRRRRRPLPYVTTRVSACSRATNTHPPECRAVSTHTRPLGRCVCPHRPRATSRSSTEELCCSATLSPGMTHLPRRLSAHSRQAPVYAREGRNGLPRSFEDGGRVLLVDLDTEATTRASGKRARRACKLACRWHPGCGCAFPQPHTSSHPAERASFRRD